MPDKIEEAVCPVCWGLKMRPPCIKCGGTGKVSNADPIAA